MEEVYLDHRIAIRFEDGWSARVTHVRGKLMPVRAHATADEGPDVCLKRTRDEIDRYVAFLSRHGEDEGEGV